MPISPKISAISLEPPVTDINTDIRVNARRDAIQQK